MICFSSKNCVLVQINLEAMSDSNLAINKSFMLNFCLSYSVFLYFYMMNYECIFYDLHFD